MLEATLRLLHPLIPFVTEEIWQHIAPKLGIDAPSISLQAYPQATDFADDHAAAEADIEWLKSVVSALRRIRSELNIPPAKQVALLLQGGNANDRRRMTRFDAQLKFLVRVESVAWLESSAAVPFASAALIGELKLLIPLAGLIDLDAERARLEKEIRHVGLEIAKCTSQLSNETFVKNAPASVVEQLRLRLVDWTSKNEALKKQYLLLSAQWGIPESRMPAREN